MSARIGVPPCFFHPDPTRPIFKGKRLLYFEESLLKWAKLEGAELILLPTLEGSSSTEKQAKSIDGLLLQGGSDVSPESYGETPIQKEWSGDFYRDQIEIALIKECLKQKKPILAVCRGLQILNVALGGTLIQDIQTQNPSAFPHKIWERYDKNFHEILFEPGRLSKIYGKIQNAKVNSIHHQAISKLGAGLLIEARSSSDQIIEAVSLPEEDFVFGIQWHPEFQSKNDSDLLDPKPLLREFLKAAKDVAHH